MQACFLCSVAVLNLVVLITGGGALRRHRAIAGVCSKENEI